MTGIPVVGFSAYSGTGKTTLIEKIIKILKAKGLRVAVIKHDAHDFDIDREGKDSWRFTHAGADVTVISSNEKTAVIEQRKRTLEDNISSVKDVDVILVEGYTDEKIPRIALARRETGKGLRGNEESFIAIASDYEMPEAKVPVFSIDDAGKIADFIIDYIKNYGVR